MSKRKKSRSRRKQAPAPSEEAVEPVRKGRKRLLPVLAAIGAGIVLLLIARPFLHPDRAAPGGGDVAPAEPREPLTTEGLEEEMLDAVRRLVAEFPDDPDTYGLMGMACSKVGQQDEAVSWYQRSLELNPQLAEAHFFMGEAALRQGEFELAVERYRKAMEISPNLPGVRRRLGQALVELGRPAGAVEVLESVPATDPEAAGIDFPLGQAYVQLQEYEKALPHLERAAGKMPGDPLPVYALAKAHARLGHRDKAGEFNRKFRRLRDAEVEVQRESRNEDLDLVRMSEVASNIHSGVGQVYARKGRLQEAEEHLRRATLLFKDDQQCRQVLFDFCMRNRKWSEALEVCRELLQIDPGHAVHRLNEGVALYYLGDLVGAEKSIRQSLRMEPRNPAGYHSLVRVLSHGGHRLPEAKAAAEQLVALEPTAGNYSILGGLCRQTGDQAGARAAMERARQLESGGM